MSGKASLIGMLLLAGLGAGMTGTRYSTAQSSAQNGQHTSKSTGHRGSKPQEAQSADEGERIFQQNCSRCHNAPEGFPPSISATVARHMRMRANLSQHDEQELLKYLNP